MGNGYQGDIRLCVVCYCVTVVWIHRGLYQEGTLKTPTLRAHLANPNLWDVGEHFFFFF